MTTLTNDELLAKLDQAFKSVTDTSDFGDSVLQPQKFDQFVREMQHRAVMLPEARFIPMDAQQTDIDRTGFVGRILRSGSSDDGGSRTLQESEFAKPQFATNKLIAVELQAITSLRDRALRRNIERGNFEGTLVDLFGEAAGRDFEEFALLSDTGWAHADDDVLSKTDGWLKQAANKIYGRDVAGQEARDFDPDATDWPENLFEAMLLALPKQFLQDTSEWRFYVPWDVRNDYQERLKTRGTELGDRAQTETSDLRYKGIPVVYVPLLERANAVDLTSDTQVSRDRVEGAIATLQHPDNLAWGVFHEVTIEREREAKERRTDFVLSFEGDADYEDENAAVVAFIDKANPAASSS